MLWWLVILLAIAFCCSFVAPDSGLHKSALQAFDSSVGMLSRAGVEQSATSRRKRAESVDYEPDAEGTPAHRLYDLSVDPTEQSDLSASRPEDVARLSALITAHQRDWASARPQSLEGGARAAAMLRAIGYAGEDE